MIGGKSIFREWIETDGALIRILKVHLLPHFKPKFLKKADTKWKKTSNEGPGMDRDIITAHFHNRYFFRI